MNWEQEAKLKEAAQQQCATPYGEATAKSMGGAIGCDTAQSARPSLRERVSMDLHRSMREVRKRDRLEELSYLLDKNPDIARILDLIEEVR